MADIQSPFGLRAKKTITGATYTGQNTNTSRTILSGYNTNIFKGDPVSIVGGYVVRYTRGAGPLLYGVFNGCFFYDASGKPSPLMYWPAGQVSSQVNVYANIIDDPNVLYEIQSNATPGFPQTSLMKNANLVAGVGSTNTGQSAFALDQSSIPADATGDVKIYALGQEPNNNWAVAGAGGTTAGYNTVLVRLNNTMLNTGTASAT